MKRGRDKRWVVRAGDGTTVADIVKKAGEDPTGAIAGGRVFLGKKRVIRADEAVRVGDEVKIGAATDTSERRSVILFEKNGIVACVKDAGIPSVPDHAGSAHSLVARVASAVGRRADELFVTSRLDREVSGVVLFATTPEAESRLREARAQGLYHRRYLAIAHAPASGAASMPDDRSTGAWDSPIEGKPSRTLWSPVARAGDFLLLAVSPVTGRTHQIRIHASRAGMPLLGDRDYGGPSRVTLPNGRVVALPRIALHAGRVTVPEGAATVVAEAPVPPELARAWTELGGAPEAWDTALSCALEP